MGENEAQVLWPDQTVTLSDEREVTVCQLRAAQEERYHDDVVPIRRAIRDTIGHSDDPDEVTAAFYKILDEHGPSLSRLVRACTDLTGEDWETLTSHDLAHLRVTWLGVHLRPFAQLHMMVQVMTQAVVSAGSSSSAP